MFSELSCIILLTSSLIYTTLLPEQAVRCSSSLGNKP